MYRLLILSFVAVTALAEDFDVKECARVFQPNSMRCCKYTAELKEKFKMTDDLKECLQLPKDTVLCEHELCIAKKKGYATDDGKLDKKKLEEMLTKDIENADLLKDIKLKCINADIEKYGLPEFCDFTKMNHCIQIQILNHCSEWNDFENCKEIQELVKECVKFVP